jgi:hypothetical protein
MLPLRPVSALVLLASLAAAQSPTLSKIGGAAPGTTTLPLAGNAGDPYAVVVGFAEAPTTLPSGAVLEVPLTWISLTFALPGFFGVLDGTGAAAPTFALGSDPSLVGLQLSFQAVSGAAFDAASNLTRVTVQAPGTFADSREAPLFPVVGGVATLAADGKLHVIDGAGLVEQVWDPEREEFDVGAALVPAGLLSTATVLADGRILFTGGLSATTGQPQASATLFDPVTGQSTALAMSVARAGHAASLLGDGRVLITGGFATLDLADVLGTLTSLHASTEFFDPGTGTFSPGPGMLEARALHTSTSTDDGGCLVAGGLTVIPIVGVPLISNTAYSYNPALGIFGLPQLFSGARILAGATKLADGRVLICGGLSLDLTRFLLTLDPLTITASTLDDCQAWSGGLFGGFSTVSGMSDARAWPGVLALDDGTALVAGGFEATLDIAAAAFSFGLLGSADRYDPSSGLAATGDLSGARLQPLLAPLPDGTVMVLGGGPLEAEVYQP